MTSGIRPVSPATDMLKNMVVSALFAGFVTGLVVAALQTVMLEPLILEAELYETGQLVHFADVSRAMPDVEIEWDWVRVAFSFVSSIAVYIAFSLMIVALFAFANLRNIEIPTRLGILWGLAGFASVSLFPSLGLAPELPGMYAAELQPRQIWWFGTVIASAVGIGLLVFGKDWTKWGIGLVLIALPHAIGAPHPDFYGGVVPPELASDFTARSLGLSAISWSLLGLVTAYFWEIESRN